jgi:transposase-like protein
MRDSVRLLLASCKLPVVSAVAAEGDSLICNRCHHAMREEKRSFHKKRKWICPHCGRARMQQVQGRIHKGKGKSHSASFDEN